jgi:hypothetical protein
LAAGEVEPAVSLSMIVPCPSLSANRAEPEARDKLTYNVLFGSGIVSPMSLEPPTPVSTPAPTDWLLLVVPGLIWGASFLFIAEGLRSIGPNGLTFLRILVGFCTLALVPGKGRQRMTVGSNLEEVADRIGKARGGPVIAVCGAGDKEVEAGSVSLRHRQAGDLGVTDAESLGTRIASLVAERATAEEAQPVLSGGVK